MKQEEIEMQLWEYIDGICNEADRQRISLHMAEDAAWKEKFEELSAFNSSITDNLELEQPSLRFTKNVMEAVAATRIAPATKKYINPAIIRGIAAFFIIIITAIMGYAFATAKWSTGTSLFTDFPLKKIDLSSLLNSAYINIFIMVNIVLGLVLLDSILSKKRTNPSI